MKRLDEYVPEKGFRGPDEMLDAFLSWVGERGLSLYAHQQDAVLELMGGAHVVLDAPTGSGKSLVATALLFKTFAETGRSFYTAPIKALVSEKFFELCGVFGADNVGMMTGDGAINRDAPILCCTAEILSNLALRDPEAKVSAAVLDEFHYYGDRDRGMAWQVPLLALPKTQFLLLSGTLGDTRLIREDLAERTGRPVAEIVGVHRPVPLEWSWSMKPIHEALADLVRGDKAPVYAVHFTQAAATEQAQALMSVDWCTKEEKKAIAEAVRGFSFHSSFGPTVRRFVLHGVGVHHAGLLPRYRRLVERLAQQRLLKIICGTDTLGVGINVPIRTVLFTQLCKFDGEKVVLLPVREFKQIAGRAGRAGFDRVGYVVAQAPAWVIENARIAASGKKKAVKAQPPTKGYKHWDEPIYRRMIESPPEPLESRFSIDHGRVLTMMQAAEERDGDAAGGVKALHELIDRSHSTAKAREQLHQRADQLLTQLETVGIARREGEAVHLDPELQHDFTLHHSLSLFLLEAIAGLDRTSPTYALDVVSWVEAILEHPRPVLLRQVDRAKGELIEELKARGVPYEERMEALEEVSWPKPLGEQIYAFYNAYSARHPWVGEDSIRPKSVVREMVSLSSSFTEYVNLLGIQRSEGVLLRYLTEAYRALVNNVPEVLQTEELLDIAAYLRTMLGHVDSSLLTEWEDLVRDVAPPEYVPPKRDISADKRSFAARLRAELHALVRAVSRGDWEEAAASLRHRGDAADRWDADALAKAFEPVLAELGGVAFDHRARLSANTTITSAGPHEWIVRQRILAPFRADPSTVRIPGEDPGRFAEEDEQDSTWSVEARVDLRDDTDPKGPLLELVDVAS